MYVCVSMVGMDFRDRFALFSGIHLLFVMFSCVFVKYMFSIRNVFWE